ncbi:MAG TPA: hypothetical protein VII67_07040 [Acidimicrobiales bacterium]
MILFKRTSILLSSLAVLSATFVLGSPLAAHASVSNPTAASVIAAATTAVNKEIGVHVNVLTVSGKVDTTVVAKIGTLDGIETYHQGGETFVITVTPAYAYLSGSLTGLTTVMGLTAAEQKKVGTSSISMKKGSAPYKTFKKNLTSAAFAQLLPALKGTTLLPARDKKTNGYQLKWNTAATSTAAATTSVLTISSGAKTLPIKETVTTSGGTSQTTFTKWNKKVSVVAPTKTIKYATVFG